jgi:cell division transport system ATP-binding protein
MPTDKSANKQKNKGRNNSHIMLIEYKNVEVYQETQEVLTDVSFTIDEGELAYIIGKVGSGKSSLLKTIYGELPIHNGEASVMGYDLPTLKRKHLPELRRKLGIIFQDFQLLTDRTVEANLKFVLKATGWKNKVEIQTRIQEVLDLVGMSTKGYKLPSELSGGEQQRIAIARAILNHPKLILADEPTGNLDSETSNRITELLQRIVKEQGSTVLMITHNTHLLEKFPGRVFECKDKKLSELGTADKEEEEKELEVIEDEIKNKENPADDEEMEIIENLVEA